MMDTTISLISRRDSTMLKGLLILLIVLGHNGILMGKVPGLTVTTFNDYLYHFHVYLFLMLPFLYNIPKSNCQRIKKDFVHLYKPYVLMCLALLFINVFVMKEDFNLSAIAYAFLSGNELLLRSSIGGSFPWFMPVMFTLLLFRNYFFVNKKRLAVMFVLSATAFVFIRVQNEFSIYGFPYIIMGGTVAVTYFSLAVCCRYIYEKYNTCRYFNIISVIVFIISTFIFFLAPNFPKEFMNIVSWIMLPISSLYTFILFVQKVKNKYMGKTLEYLGRESLPIYMIHVFVYNALLMVVQKLQISLDVMSGIIVLALTIMLTILIIYLSYKVRIYKYIFQ